MAKKKLKLKKSQQLIPIYPDGGFAGDVKAALPGALQFGAGLGAMFIPGLQPFGLMNMASGVGSAAKGVFDYETQQTQLKALERDQQAQSRTPEYFKPAYSQLQQGGLPTFLYQARGRAMRNANPEYFRDGGVSNKISLLVDEGYPQKQAVAIALDMDRRNKLQKGGLPQWLYDARGRAIEAARNKMEYGGDPYSKVMEVEKNELKTRKGKIIEDYKNLNPHINNGFREYIDESEKAKKDTIITAKSRNKYLDSELMTRLGIENRLVRDQAEKEQEQLSTENAMMMKRGGIYIKPSKRGSLHTHLGIPQEQKIPASELAIKSTDSPAIRKKKQFAINARKWKHEEGGLTDLSYYQEEPEDIYNQDLPVSEFGKGGMNFKSSGAYKRWLGYGHATGVFARTPGHQKVSIKGQSKKVKHMQGGGYEPVSPQGTYLSPEDRYNQVMAYRESQLFTQKPLYEIPENRYKNLRSYITTPEDPNTPVSPQGTSQTYRNYGFQGAPLREEPFQGAEWNPNWGFDYPTSPLQYQTSLTAKLPPNTFPKVYPSNQKMADTEGESKIPRGQIGTIAATALPAVYNYIASLQETPEEEYIKNLQQEKALSLFGERYDPAYGLRQIGLAGKAYRRDLAQRGLGQGQIENLMYQSSGEEMKKKADYLENVRIANMERNFAEGRERLGTGEADRQAKILARGETLRRERTKAQFLPTALGQTSYLIQGLQRQGRKAEASKLLYEALNEIDRNKSLSPEEKKTQKENLTAAHNAYQSPTGSSLDQMFAP